MAWCFTVLQFDYMESVGRLDFTYEGFWTGDAFSGLSSISAHMFLVPLGATGIWGGGTFSPGVVSTFSGYTEWTGSGYSLDTNDFYFSYDDPVAGFDFCGVERLSRRACHEPVGVPEPGTYLLILSGVLGLGFVGYRRKDDLST